MHLKERWLSGRRHRFGVPASGKLDRGFESLPLRKKIGRVRAPAVRGQLILLMTLVLVYLSHLPAKLVHQIFSISIALFATALIALVHLRLFAEFAFSILAKADVVFSQLFPLQRTRCRYRLIFFILFERYVNAFIRHSSLRARQFFLVSADASRIFFAATAPLHARRTDLKCRGGQSWWKLVPSALDMY